MDPVRLLFEKYTGQSVRLFEELPSSGSNRRYFRITGDDVTLIGARGTSIPENIAFWKMATHFYAKGLNVPKVLAHNDDFSCYLQEDLGNDTLFSLVAEGREKGVYSPAEKALIVKAIRALPKIQFEGAQGLDFSVCFPQPEFDERMISFDQNYFKYCFLKATGLEFSEIELDKDFHAMSDVLMRSMSDTFLYRDFQARNVMIKYGEPYFIDFQGGRKGPIYYDVASFIWQAKAAYSEAFKMELIDAYLDALRPYAPIPKQAFLKTLRHFVLFRTLQVLGAYGFRGYFEKKPHFLQSVPYAMENLRRLLKGPFEEYPYLTKILDELTRMKQFSDMNQERGLEVDIFSFAYKKGIPNDASGNGGGYVSAAQDLLALWLDNQKMLIQKSKHYGDTTTTTAGGKALLKNIKTIVLVNGTTASASEIVAGALKDYGKATIVGEKTYGKGVVQNMFDLSNGSMLKVTTAAWFTPKENSINGEGITPDVEVERTYEDINAMRDPQLDKAKAL